MLRFVLAVALMVVIGLAGFYTGRATAPSPLPPVLFKSPPPSGVALPPVPADTKTRARIVEPPASPPEINVTPPTVEPPHGLEKASAELPGPLAKLPTALDGRIGLPIAGLRTSDIQDTFSQSRSNGERAHEATDIMAPRGTPVIAVSAGIIKKLFDSKPGGITVYQFDSTEQYCFYYAHLDRYAERLHEGQLVKRGDRLGYVGSTGNANPAAPHLHFAIFELGPEKRWYEGKPLNPYPLLMKVLK